MVINETEQSMRSYLCKFEITVDEGPLQKLLAGWHHNFIFLVHKDLIEVTVLNLLPCRPAKKKRKKKETPLFNTSFVEFPNTLILAWS